MSPSSLANRKKMQAAKRRPVVGVMGSGVRPCRSLAVPLGRLLARMDVHLLTGGGAGAMAAVSQAFAEADRRAGLVIGVLPGRSADGEPPPGYPNPWVEVELRTRLEARGEAGGSAISRNHINVLSSDVVVALPGGAGTRSEALLALRYNRPLILLGDWSSARGAKGLNGAARASTAAEAASFAAAALKRLQRPSSSSQA